MRKHRVKMYGALLVLLLSAGSACAVSFDWAEIGNAGNVPDTEVMADGTSGYGSVGYDYRIATTEVTNAQYIEFLNAVAKTDTHGLYNNGGITRSGTSGNYSYSLKNNDTNWANRPVVYVSWYDALRFANWLSNGQPTGDQDASTTEYGAYDMSLGSSVVRLAGADYWLPSEDEWYKAAYYDPVDEVYYNYATGSDSLPDNNTPTDDTGNSANYCDYLGYFNGGFTLGSPYYTTEVGAYSLSASPYGTYDQTGNVWEWNEALIESSYRGVRGGSLYSEGTLPSSFRNYGNPATEHNAIGFRVASSAEGAIPEPMSIVLSSLAFSVLYIYRRFKRL